jgi:methionyl-tRNA formyltransferase
LRIIFFGEDVFSSIVLRSLIESRFQIIAAHTPFYNNLIYKKLENVCVANNIDFERIHDFKSNDYAKKLKLLSPDIIAICHFQKLLPKSIISTAKIAVINLHPSLLPKYRGMSPQHWPLINGDSKTGISIHLVDEGTDTGDIILQEEIEIRENDYVSDLQERFKEIYKYIYPKALNKFLENPKCAIKQIHSNATYFGRLRVSDCTLNLGMTVNEAYNLIRAVSKPYFGARINNLIIWNAMITQNDLLSQRNKIGLYLLEDSNPFLILNDGILEITKFEYEK